MGKSPWRKKPEVIIRARELIASGKTFTEVSAIVGINRVTLIGIAKREHWLIPADHPPPPLPLSVVKAVQAAQATQDPKSPPPPPPKADLLEYSKDLLRYALETLAACPMTPGLALSLADKMPGIIRALAAIPEERKDESPAVLADIQSRLVQLSKDMRPKDDDEHSRGETDKPVKE